MFSYRKGKKGINTGFRAADFELAGVDLNFKHPAWKIYTS
jgi:hypothetical protein